jgi:hypothetical protein
MVKDAAELVAALKPEGDCSPACGGRSGWPRFSIVAEHLDGKLNVPTANSTPSPPRGAVNEPGQPSMCRAGRRSGRRRREAAQIAGVRAC